VIPGHPERPERLIALEAALELVGWLGWERREAPRASLEALQAVHPAAHVEAVRDVCARSGSFDADTATGPGTWEAALRAAGGAVAMVDALLGEGVPGGFVAMRPPGHHAEPTRAMGFCFLNSVAVAARRARDEHGVGRVLILDWDVHHGNGTSAAFHATDEVLFSSIHQSPLYPGTGAATDLGRGPGHGYTVNLPVPPGTGDDGFVSLVQHVVAPLARAYRPGLVLVSAGFDAHHEDPLAECLVTEAGYAAMTAALKQVCGELGAPLGMVLEGGYAVPALVRSVLAVLPVLAEAAAPPEPAAEHPLAVDAVARLAPLWPSLSAG